MKERRNLLVFDVNETLLNMSSIQLAINRKLGSDTAFHLWFSRLLEFSSAETLTGNYVDFGKVGQAVLQMTAQNFSVDISISEIKDILEDITQLPAHPEVPEALERLKKGGYILVALTNGGEDTLEKQLNHSGLQKFFDESFSVEAVKKFKPHPEPYKYVLNDQKIEAEQAMMIAAHGWDILGAQRAGLKTAFVSRPQKYLYPNQNPPNLSGKDLQEIADQIL